MKTPKTKLHASNLNIRLLATRSDLPLGPGLVVDQTPQPGEEVERGYAVAVTVSASKLAIVSNENSLPPSQQAEFDQSKIKTP